MKVRGKIVVNRPPDELWNLLLSPDVLRRCIPGCETIKKESENHFRVTLRVGVGLIKGRFRGTVRICDQVPGKSYVFEIKARGLTGFIEGRTSLSLAPLDGTEDTELEYEGEGKVGGALAAVGARLFQSAARSFQEEFFRNLATL